MPTISCPHCGTQRNMPQARLPQKPSRARCPACGGSFLFDPQAAPAAAPAADDLVTCPRCSLPRQIPATRTTAAGAVLSCRRCRHSFTLASGRQSSRGSAPLTAPRTLQSIGLLLTASWELFCRSGWTLLAIYLLGGLLLLAPLAATTLTVLPQLQGDNRLTAAFLLGAAGYGFWALSWLSATIFHAITAEPVGLLPLVRRGWQSSGRFAGLLLLLALLVGGGSLLLLLPGLVLMVWFCFAQYILAEEAVSPLSALKKSRELVRGHWWSVCARLLLISLVSMAITALSGRLPVIGPGLNLALTLLLTPFSLCYSYRLYQDLKRVHNTESSPEGGAASWPYFATALFGWLLIPGLLLLGSLYPQSPTETGPLADLTRLLAPRSADIPLGPTPLRPLPAAQKVSAADYDRLLQTTRLAGSSRKTSLGPALLMADRFWADSNNPHLWLNLQLADLPNVDLANQRSVRVRIDKVLDQHNHNLYNPSHSFESRPFQWITLHANATQESGFHGIRNIYLQQGTEQNQIRSISGRLELSLPLDIETRQLGRADIGKTLQVAGHALTLKKLADDRITLTFLGSLQQLLSIRAVDAQNRPLSDVGRTWQTQGDQLSLEQMFDGDVEAVTILVASDTLTRSYPFEIVQ